jgi:hypothetical protein
MPSDFFHQRPVVCRSVRVTNGSTLDCSIDARHARTKMTNAGGRKGLVAAGFVLCLLLGYIGGVSLSSGGSGPSAGAGAEAARRIELEGMLERARRQLQQAQARPASAAAPCGPTAAAAIVAPDAPLPRAKAAPASEVLSFHIATAFEASVLPASASVVVDPRPVTDRPGWRGGDDGDSDSNATASAASPDPTAGGVAPVAEAAGVAVATATPTGGDPTASSDAAATTTTLSAGDDASASAAATNATDLLLDGVDTTYINRSFVAPWKAPGTGLGTEGRRATERVHILAFNNFFHPQRSAAMNGTCAMLESAAAMGYTTTILFGEGTKLRSRENGAKLLQQMRLALKLVSDPLDFILFVDLHDTIFTLPAHEMLDRYFAPPLSAPPFIVQGDHTMFGHAAHRKMYDTHYGASTVAKGIAAATLFPFPNGGLFFARKKYLEVAVKHFFGHPAASMGIDMGWISIKTVTDGLLQSGFVVIDAVGALSQNLNGGGIGRDDGAARFMPRNGRIFDVAPTCTQATRPGKKGKNVTRAVCEAGTGVIAPRSRVAPIWHFPGPSKYFMPATLALLKLPVTPPLMNRSAFFADVLGKLLLLRVAKSGEVRQSYAPGLCDYHAPSFLQLAPDGSNEGGSGGDAREAGGA